MLYHYYMDMDETSSEHRLAENEAMFRRINEQVQSGYDETNRLAAEDDQPEFMVGIASASTPIDFYCECADEKCAKRVTMSPQEYQEIHRNRRQFIIAPGHEVTSVEKVIAELPTYTIVEKNVQPPEDPDTMHPTSIKNA
jgi:hypothetical protein